ncbi:hypothetical protein BC940DRAFT_289740 [Gongronella butleri]|nr:hypothetical protein BC940DRAFT_289740 [Gongronella butleri]
METLRTPPILSLAADLQHAGKTCMVSKSKIDASPARRSVVASIQSARNTPAPASLESLPTELLVVIFRGLDSLDLHELCRVSSRWRFLLMHQPLLWQELRVDPGVAQEGGAGTTKTATTIGVTRPQQQQRPQQRRALQLLHFLVSHRQLHRQVVTVQLSRCPFLDAPLLKMLVHALPNIRQLYVAQCPLLNNWWYILYMLKDAVRELEKEQISFKSINEHDFDTPGRFLLALEQYGKAPTSSPCASLTSLRHLRELHIRGAFPSEHAFKSHGHEMFGLGEVNKALLQLAALQRTSHDDAVHLWHADGAISTTVAPPINHDVQDHYQFWLLLRAAGTHAASVNPYSAQTDLWMPSPLVDAMKAMECRVNDKENEAITLDLVFCPLCSRNVAKSPTLYPMVSCQQCRTPTSHVCALCQCHACAAILCTDCNTTQKYQTSTTNPWMVVQCPKCKLHRRVCHNAACIDREKDRPCGICENKQ